MYDRIITKTETQWECQERQKQLEWETIWSTNILQKFHYGGNTSWCIKWEGKQDATIPTETLLANNGVSREVIQNVPWWNCSEIWDCDSNPDEITIPPVRVALKAGCACRGYKSGGQMIPYHKPDCKYSTIKSMGNFVWANSDGTWTTHLPVTGKVKEITLGLPTLCPIWKRSPFKGKLETLQINRIKRDIKEDDTWQKPSTGVKVGWALESLFAAPVATYRNRDMIYKLIGQTERLARVTKKGFRDLNMQLKATTKMTLQNRRALDILLLKEHGVCGYLKDRVDHCCVHIPNVTMDIEYDISQLKRIEQEAEEERKEIGHNWIGELFNGLGIHLGGWLQSLLETICTLLLVFLVIYLVYLCIRQEITCNTSWTHKIIGAVTREYPRRLTPPPKYYETTRMEN
ncbi:uncharacterized protein LOC128853667 [Cuculus canorus]|uniref:uncharacterized protein LOC128853667 n=1 Tax=Cuculus canorus TaxID=55661 RepID=UPI0023AB0D08|nr:uncharacterized protein LOC128853667 [Cuculus canorus]